MTTRRTLRLHLWSLAAAAAIAASVSGCQPKESSEHACACICYKEAGNTVYMLNQSVSTTKECGNVNGSACSGDVGGQHIDGQYANCGPNDKVAITFYNAITAALEAKSAIGKANGLSNDHDGGTGTNTATNSDQ
jgi:hypothetical protein